MQGCSSLRPLVLRDIQLRSEHCARDLFLNSRPHYLDLAMGETKARLPESLGSDAKHFPCFLSTERQVVNEGRMDEVQCDGFPPKLDPDFVQDEVCQCGARRSPLRQMPLE